jgi:acyl-CoA reductase-like NAD-dependent aldehyde dehydrogenase
MAVVDEEQFGPVLPVIPYRDAEAAVAAANGTQYGLDASVWSADEERAAALAPELDCGTVWINAHQELGPYIPFGGRKWSGVGVENARWGMEQFVEPQVIYRSRA